VPQARILLIGSADQYGAQAPGTPALREDFPLAPHSPYARSKAAAEQLGLRAAASGQPVVNVRAFNHTGPGQTDRFVAPSFARQVAEIEAGVREPRMRVGNLDSVRDFLHVDDVLDAYLRLLDPAVAPDVYNVAGGSGVTIRSLLDALIERAGISPTIEVDPARYRPTDRLVGDASRLTERTGWTPRVSRDALYDGLLADWRERTRAASA
jgi:GDP-4-dehydro-6-deoxy-D-mannose reductase